MIICDMIIMHATLDTPSSLSSSSSHISSSVGGNHRSIPLQLKLTSTQFQFNWIQFISIPAMYYGKLKCRDKNKNKQNEDDNK